MKINIKPHKVALFTILLLIIGSLMFSSCRRSRYRRMVKKRRYGTSKNLRHKGQYQKKLRKKTLSVESPYYIKKKKNFKRRPWYN
jgi:hypothetical protein